MEKKLRPIDPKEVKEIIERYLPKLLNILTKYGGKSGSKILEVGSYRIFYKEEKDGAKVFFQESEEFDPIPLQYTSIETVGKLIDFLTHFNNAPTQEYSYESRLAEYFGENMQKVESDGVVLGHLGLRKENNLTVVMFASSDESMATLSLMDGMQSNINTLTKDLDCIGEAILKLSTSLKG